MSKIPERCDPCAGRPARLGADELAALQRELPGWRIEGEGLRRSYRLRDFRAALAWIGRVGELADERGHHPDIHLTGWNAVELVWWTHSAGGLTLSDFVLAQAVDALRPAPETA